MTAQLITMAICGFLIGIALGYFQVPPLSLKWWVHCIGWNILGNVIIGMLFR